MTYLNEYFESLQIGLCQNLKNLSWYSPQNADDFFPRCFKLGVEEDRLAFIDEYRLTCCVGLLKYVRLKYMGESDDDEPDVHITSAEEMKKMNLIAEEADADTANQSTDIEQTDTFSPSVMEPFRQQAYPRNFFSYTQ